MSDCNYDFSSMITSFPVWDLKSFKRLIQFITASACTWTKVYWYQSTPTTI